ncbi:hypothetical protein TRVA0_035S01706 [Trichomonascus vanleenenianus]|uniref:uncharacterized protein n=1 Tax=Trichomonascus vanleenenianus TaxID=2268995 RepID=UPI003EC95A50
MESSCGSWGSLIMLTLLPYVQLAQFSATRNAKHVYTPTVNGLNERGLMAVDFSANIVGEANIHNWATGILSNCSFGGQVVFCIERDLISVHSRNSSDSALLKVVYKKPYFEKYQYTPPLNSTRYLFSITSKVLGVILPKIERDAPKIDRIQLSYSAKSTVVSRYLSVGSISMLDGRDNNGIGGVSQLTSVLEIEVLNNNITKVFRVSCSVAEEPPDYRSSKMFAFEFDARLLRKYFDAMEKKSDQFSMAFGSSAVDINSISQGIFFKKAILKQPSRTRIVLPYESFYGVSVPKGLSLSIIMKEFRSFIQWAEKFIQSDGKNREVPVYAACSYPGDYIQFFLGSLTLGQHMKVVGTFATQGDNSPEAIEKLQQAKHVFYSSAFTSTNQNASRPPAPPTTRTEEVREPEGVRRDVELFQQNNLQPSYASQYETAYERHTEEERVGWQDNNHDYEGDVNMGVDAEAETIPPIQAEPNYEDEDDDEFNEEELERLTQALGPTQPVKAKGLFD